MTTLCHSGNFLAPKYILPTIFYSVKNDKWSLDGREHFCDTMCADCDGGTIDGCWDNFVLSILCKKISAAKKLQAGTAL
jgi:hypothetical protein